MMLLLLAALSISMAVVRGEEPAVSATLTVKNSALNQVTFMDASCQAGSARTLDAGKELSLPLSQGAHKFWVVPKGCTTEEGCYPCGLDCRGCFFIDPIVAANGVMVTGIGYGENDQVKVHEGVSGVKFTSVNAFGKEEDAECNTASCDTKHIIQAQSNQVLEIQGASDTVMAKAQATLTIKNSASNQVTFMDASCQAGSARTLDAGKELSVPLSQGAHKFWVVPKGCTTEEGCYPCGLDCRGCFFIDPIVAANGVMVTGIGYGENDQVKVHEGVSGVKFTSVNAFGKEEDAECNSDSCDTKHIIQAQSNQVLEIQGVTDTVTTEAQATLTIKNSASNQVTFMDASCQAGSARILDAGKEFSLPLSQGAHKFWVVPKGCTTEEGCYPCGLDCRGCFFIDPIVAANGVMDTGIGYGENDQVKVHEGVSGVKFTSVNAFGKEEDAECNAASCDTKHIIQAQSNQVLEIQGASDTVTAEAQATLTIKNSASNQVTFMDASCQAGSARTLDAGKELSLPLSQGAHKFWVVPKGCTTEEGCYPCGLDCRGCFFIDPIVAANGVMVTGIGYGENDQVKVHEGVSGVKFTSVNAFGKEEDSECTTASCDTKHIIQARSNMVFTIEGSQAVIV